jgi:ATP-binding cassette subfamily F protein 3
LNSSVDSFYLVEKGKLEIFNGDLEDYKNLILNIKNFDNKTITKKKKNKAIDREDGIKQSKNLKSEISKLEKRLQRLNKKLNEANEELANPDLYSGNPSDNLQDLIRNQLELSNEVERVEKEWIENVTKLEKLTS